MVRFDPDIKNLIKKCNIFAAFKTMHDFSIAARMPMKFWADMVSDDFWLFGCKRSTDEGIDIFKEMQFWGTCSNYNGILVYFHFELSFVILN